MMYADFFMHGNMKMGRSPVGVSWIDTLDFRFRMRSRFQAIQRTPRTPQIIRVCLVVNSKEVNDIADSIIIRCVVGCSYSL